MSTRPVGAGRPAGSDSIQTQRTLLAAAVEQVAEHGVFGASIRDITRAAGLTSASLYHHYTSKERLVTEAALDLFEDTMVRLERAASSADARLSDQMVMVLEEAHRLVQDHPDLVRFAMSLEAAAVRMPEIAQVLQDRQRREERLYEELVDAARRRGELDEDVSRQAVVDIMISITRGLTLLAASTSVARHRAAIDAMEELLLGLLFRPPRPSA